MDNSKTLPKRQRLMHTTIFDRSEYMDFKNDEEINRLYFDRDEDAIADLPELERKEAACFPGSVFDRPF